MAPLTSTVDVSLGSAGEALGFFGLTNPLEWLSVADGDPESIHAQFAVFEEVATVLEEGARSLGLDAGITWTGTASVSFAEILEAIGTGIATFVELLVWLPEVALQIVDYVLDFFRFVLNLVILVLTAIVVIFVVMSAVVAALAASIVGSPGIPGVISAAAQAAWTTLTTGTIALLSAVATASIVMAMLVRLLDAVVEAIVSGAQDLRGLLGDRLPTMPDWDPAMPPVFPT